MKSLIAACKRAGRWAVFLWLASSHSPLHAQSPTIDPGFLTYDVAVTAYARQVVQQASGQRVLLGSFRQAGSSASNGLVRLLAGSNQLDPVFQANTAGLNTADVDRLVALPNNRLLLVSLSNNAVLTVGTVSRTGLLRLNADGTPDASFNTGNGPGIGLKDVVAQPDGKLILAGEFNQFNSLPVDRVIRLNLNGTLDATFQVTVANSNGQYASVSKALLQADGKLLLAGSFSTVQGQPAGMLARVLPTGALDTGFTTASSGLYVAGMAVQPDGKVIVSFYPTQIPVTGPQFLIRLLANGSPDTSFQPGSNFNEGFYGYLLPNQPVVVEPGGNILVATTAITYNGQPIGHLVRLLPTGSLDTSFQPQATSATLYPVPTSLQLLANGQVLTNYKLFNTDGTADPGFDAHLKNQGHVMALVRQPDGKLVVGGIFTEISGQAAGSLARLNADGTPDVAFTVAAATNGIVYDLALQPDGKVVVGGDFSQLGGFPRRALGRLLPGGQGDGTFDAAIQPPPSSLNVPIVRNLALQADGNVLIAGMFLFQPGGGANSSRTSARLLGSNGQLDPSFPNLSTFNVVRFLVQPDGNIVLGGQGRVGSQPFALVQRIQPDGTPDPTFVPSPSTVTFETVRAILRDATGRLYVGGQFTQFGGVPTSAVARLLANGTPDPTFTSSLGSQSNVYALALQPNGRLLAGGGLITNTGPTSGTARLLANGSTDASYAPANGPDLPVYRLVVQPNGAIVAAGAFTTVSGLPIVALTRLLDPNVLYVSGAQSRPQTAAWPVPAQGLLHLQLDATARPRQVVLRDAVGRPVRREATSASNSTLTLRLDGLLPGVYTLNTEYLMGGWVNQRVLIE